MKKKVIKVGIVVFVIVILCLWISGIIPKQIARIYATNYLKRNFPKAELEYVDMEWASAFGDYVIYFKGKDDYSHGFIIGPKYFPVQFGQGFDGFKENYKEKYENQNVEKNNEGENELKEVEFTRTYNIVANLNMTDAIGENNFYVVKQFQNFEPIVVKVNKEYTLEEKANYEFTFKGTKKDGKEYYTLQEIFDTFDITNIEKTDKIGLEQRQDGI